MTNVDFDSERTAMLYSLGLLLKFNKIIKENCVYISLKFKHSIHISNIWYHQNNANDLRIFYQIGSICWVIFTGCWKMDSSILTGYWCWIYQQKLILITFIIHKLFA